MAPRQGHRVAFIARLSNHILRYSLNYPRYFNVITFKLVKEESQDGNLKKLSVNENPAYVVRECFYYKWYCILSRFIWITFYLYSYLHCRLQTDKFLNVLITLEAFSCLICSLAVLMLQFWYNKKALNIFNGFLRVFRRLRAMQPYRQGFGGIFEFIMVFIKLFCICIDLVWVLPELFEMDTFLWYAIFIAEIYVFSGALILMHISFVGYMALGTFYIELNNYVQYLGSKVNVSRRIKHTKSCLKECIEIYKDLHKLGQEFNDLIALPLSVTLFASCSGIAAMFYGMLVEKTYQHYDSWFIVLKLSFDVVLLTLAAQRAVSSSRVVRRLSLECAYDYIDKRWNLNLEMFLNRLNFYELRVCPLGLFEVSNELLLFFISGLVTYMTYIVQSAMQAQHI